MKTHFCKETPCIEQDREIKKILELGCEATYTNHLPICGRGLLHNVYNEPMSFGEMISIIILVGIPFALLFALIYALA